MKDKSIKLILLIVFSILCYVNYRYLNIGFLSIFSIDEYSYHGSLLNMYEGLISFNIKKMFSFGFFSYGFGFFFLNMIATLSFFARDNIEMTIYIPRVINSLFAIGSIWYIYCISKHFSSKISAILISLIILSMPGFWRNAFIFHPDWMMTFFLILTIYFLVKDNWEFKRFFWLGSLVFGMAIATKIQAITFYPILFTYAYYAKFKNRNF